MLSNIIDRPALGLWIWGMLDGGFSRQLGSFRNGRLWPTVWIMTLKIKNVSKFQYESHPFSNHISNKNDRDIPSMPCLENPKFPCPFPPQIQQSAQLQF